MMHEQEQELLTFGVGYRGSGSHMQDQNGANRGGFGRPILPLYERLAFLFFAFSFPFTAGS
jgi:hypothetical protein